MPHDDAPQIAPQIAAQIVPGPGPIDTWPRVGPGWDGTGALDALLDAVLIGTPLNPYPPADPRHGVWSAGYQAAVPPDQATLARWIGCSRQRIGQLLAARRLAPADLSPDLSPGPGHPFPPLAPGC